MESRGGVPEVPQLATAVEGIDAASREARATGHTLSGFVRRCNAVGYGFYAHCRVCGLEVAVHRVGQRWTYSDGPPRCPGPVDAPAPAVGAAASNGAGPRPVLRVLRGGPAEPRRGRGQPREPVAPHRAAARPSPPAPAPARAPEPPVEERPPVMPVTEVLAAARVAAQRAGHRLGVFRRTDGGRKFVAGCHRCGWELPVLHTHRGWCYPPPSVRCAGS
jgi:hypothetical protein